MRITGIILLALALCSCQQGMRPDRRTRELLSELDGYINARELYVVKKKDQLEALSKLAREQQDISRRYDLEMKIADEYFSATPAVFSCTRMRGENWWPALAGILTGECFLSSLLTERRVL